MAGQSLVPVGHGSDVVLQGQIASAAAPTQRLNGHAQVGLEINRVVDVPAIQAKAHLALIERVGDGRLRQSRIGRGEGFIAVVPHGILKIVGTAEVVFRARAADGGICVVAVQIEFDFAFAPPAVVIHAPGHVGAHIVAFALHAVQNGVHLFVRQRIHAPELRMKVGAFRRNGPHFVGDLVIQHKFFIRAVLHRYAAALAERHAPIAIEGGARVHAYGKGTDGRVASPAAGKKVTDGALDGRRFTPVPIEAQNRVAPGASGRHPDVADHALARNVHDFSGFAGRNALVRIGLPAVAQIARGARGYAVFGARAPAHALFAGLVFRADRAGFKIAQHAQLFQHMPSSFYGNACIIHYKSCRAQGVLQFFLRRLLRLDGAARA